ncbi:MAG: hypothetical protein RLZ98_2574 [Pseudomonadota bacterium]|jgi:tripartite-type tricarboxylate transporter receptor subunit TctC
MNARIRSLFVPLGVVASVLSTVPASADEVADFYKGKSLKIIIGYGPGGGYDLYGRIAAEWFGRFIPGNPMIVPQNMPGAGSFRAAKYLFEAAPKDGTTLGIVAQTLPLDAAMKGAAGGVDITKMAYVGRLTTNIDVGHGMPGAPFKNAEDARKMEIVVGGTGGASPSVLLPKALNAYGGTKFKVISGYKGSADIFLAAQRGEVQFVSSNGLANMLAKTPEIITGGQHPIVYQAGLKRHSTMPGVPTVPELGLTDEGKSILRTIAASADIGRSINTTPNVPAARLKALRTAFQQMVKDAAFLEKMKARKVMIEAATGEELDAIASEVARTPQATLDKIAVLLKD